MGRYCKQYRTLISTFTFVFLAGLTLLWAGQPLAAELPLFRQPDWSALSRQQQLVLSPLAAEWPQMDSRERQKWAGIAVTYAKQPAAVQRRILAQIHDWARLSSPERAWVRQQYELFRQKSPEQKALLRQQWAAYSDLPLEERMRLQTEARAQSKPKVIKKAKPTLGQHLSRTKPLHPARQGDGKPPSLIADYKRIGAPAPVSEGLVIELQPFVTGSSGENEAE